MAKTTEAQRQATAKYVKKNVKVFTLRFFPQDADLWAHLQRQPEKARYLRELIRKDMERP